MHSSKNMLFSTICSLNKTGLDLAQLVESVYYNNIYCFKGYELSARLAWRAAKIRFCARQALLSVCSIWQG